MIYNGSSSDDFIVGSDQDDTIFGLAGNDSLEGRSGDDAIFGGTGRDRIWGEVGDDSLFLGTNSGPQEYAYGGLGNDTFVVQNTTGAAALFDANNNGGDDLVVFDGFSVADVQSMQVVNSNWLNITLATGPSQTETITLRNHSNFESVQFDDLQPVLLSNFFDSFQANFFGGNSDDQFVGSPNDEIFFGFEGADTISGNLGDDLLFGGADRDRLYGGEGDDVIAPGGNTSNQEYGYGGLGNDFFQIDRQTGNVALFESSANSVSGGDDTVSFEDFSVSDILNISLNNSGTWMTFDLDVGNNTTNSITLRDYQNRFENVVFDDYGLASPQAIYDAYTNGTLGTAQIVGTSFDDLLVGTSASEEFYGLEGNDTLHGNGGTDIFYGGADVDIVEYDNVSGDSILINTLDPSQSSGAAAGDTFFEIERVHATDGDDTIFSDIDRMYGGHGNDLLFAQTTNQFAYGGTGADTLKFGEFADGHVLGFVGSNEAPAAHDLIDLSDWGATSLDQLSFSQLAGTDDLMIDYEGKTIRVWDMYDGNSLTLGAQDILLKQLDEVDRFDTFVENPVLESDFQGDAWSLLLPVGIELDYSTLTRWSLSKSGDDVFTNQDHALDTTFANLQNDASDIPVANRPTDTSIDWGTNWQNGTSNGGNNIESELKVLATAGHDVYFLGDGGSLWHAPNSVIKPTESASAGQGSDVIFAGAGDDRFDGSGGADVLFGQQGDDTLDGHTYGDFLSGGSGDDILDGGPMNDALFGGAGNDHLDGGFALDAVFGGAGNDIIVSRSDGGEPNILVGEANASIATTAEFDDPFSDGTLIQVDTSIAFAQTVLDESVNLNDPNDVHGDPIIRNGFDGVQTNDHLEGGSGDDLFVFEFTMGANEDIGLLHVGSASVIDPIDWMHVADLNNYRHQHWMDGIGDDRIYGFEVGKDELAFIGHTVQVHEVSHTDVDGDGVLDTRISLFSNHLNGTVHQSHHNDYLGAVNLMGVQWDVDESDLNADHVFDVPVHSTHNSNTIPTAGKNVGVLTQGYIDALQAEYQTQSELVDHFGSFTTYNDIGSYFSSNLSTIKTHQPETGPELRAYLEGTPADDTITETNAGALIVGGSGDDFLEGGIVDQTQFGRDYFDGGAGNDTIHGNVQDDIVFGGFGNDVILGGSVGKSQSIGDEDILFGGSGDDTISGGVQGDVVFGGAGEDVIVNASDISEGTYNPADFAFAATNFKHDATHRVLNDLLFGGEGNDTFRFDILNGTIEGGDAIDAHLGTDVISDFETSDSLDIFFHNTDAFGTEGREIQMYDATLEGTGSSTDTLAATLIKVKSNHADEMYSYDDPNDTVEIDGVIYAKTLADYNIIETDAEATIGQILVVGHDTADLAGKLTVHHENTIFTPDDFYDQFEPVSAAAAMSAPANSGMTEISSENRFMEITMSDGSVVEFPTFEIEDETELSTEWSDPAKMFQDFLAM